MEPIASQEKNEKEDITYIEDAFTNLFSKDALIVMAKGIGLKRLFAKFLEAYGRGICGRKLVIVLNASEEVWIDSALYSCGLQPHELPKVINSELNAAARTSLYAAGGTYLLTNWVAISDILHHRLVTSSVCGMLVWNAHRVTETSMEAFIIRKFKQANPAGFVKAFTDNLIHLQYQTLTLLLQTLYTPTVYLYPRFHVLVQTTLQSVVNVEERQLQLSPLMGRIQGSIIVAIKSCLAEIKRSVPHLDLFSSTESSDSSSVFDVEAELFRHTSFQALSHILEPEWHKLNSKTKQLVQDLSTFRTMLTNLYAMDSVSFYYYLLSLRSTSSTSSSPSLWLTTTAADTIFQCSRDRVYKYHTVQTSTTQTPARIRIEPRIEIPPKWLSLQNVLKEIRSPNNMSDTSLIILVIVRDAKTASMLAEFLHAPSTTASMTGSLFHKLGFYVSQQAAMIRKQYDIKETATDTSVISNANRLSAELAAVLQLERELQSQPTDSKTSNESDLNEPMAKRSRNTSAFTAPAVLFMTHQQIKACHALDLNPSYIIVYDMSVEVIRSIETAAAIDRLVPKKVFLLVYEDSTETHYYSSYLKNEKQKFEKLIEMKAHIVLPTNTYTGTDDSTAATTDTRHTVKSTTHTVIVDAREFRSPLPNILDLHQIVVVPATLVVGDYILTPNICVERKNSSSGSTNSNDLFSSFNSGRLYTQCEQMSRHYATPILLIEFDSSKQFCLQNAADIGADIKPHSIISKITLLVLAFPKLRLIWSRSAYHTVDMFKLIKNNLPQPNVDSATSIGSDTKDTDSVDSDMQQQIMDVLLTLPGISVHNVHTVMNATTSIATLVNMSLEQMIAMIGSVNGKKLYYFLNQKCN